MGQRMEVSVVEMGSIALFTTDRSLTGQDGISFAESPDSRDGPPSELARRLFLHDDGIEHVHILSNTVSVKRRMDWDLYTVEDATEVIASLFTHYAPETVAEHDEHLRELHYNATIVSIDAPNPELWVFEVRPDEPVEPFQAGQYTTLALGFWEPRADDAMEEFKEGQREKLARRSYSVSSPILTPDGDLIASHPDDIEFYVVKVSPTEDNIPALTPRLFMKEVGDRIFLGRKFTGRYTLEGVTSTDTIVFLSTGTGEAPQNAMTAELLRRGHQGQIISVVCVRYNQDLGYAETHPILMDRYPDYHYVVLTTREPETIDNKVYIQDYLKSGALEMEFGVELEPSNTHVFLCGNPAMIGLPEWTADGPVFPETLGVCQLLHERGFTIDHRRERGNVHYEEYW
jgi:ferredoxin/flavodoxin---NADP+ reductase